MFNSFLDGTKSAIEMAAVANACDLSPPKDGLLFPPCSRENLAQVLRPKDEGGVLDFSGQVEVVSSLTRDGEQIERDLRWGVYVVLEAPNEYFSKPPMNILPPALASMAWIRMRAGTTQRCTSPST